MLLVYRVVVAYCQCGILAQQQQHSGEVIITAAEEAPSEDASDDKAEEDTHYKTKFLDLMGDNGGRALTAEQQETIRAEAADAAVVAAAVADED